MAKVPLGALAAFLLSISGLGALDDRCAIPSQREALWARLYPRAASQERDAMLLWPEHGGKNPDGCQYSAYEQVDDRRGPLFEFARALRRRGLDRRVALPLRGLPNYDTRDGTRVLDFHTEHEDQFVQ
ncbi:MAG TPA: hypothetical protein VNZ53_34450 [Steroidobacteraceae bacterium]|jgi:hypothetical protein|nr:hypothetical protein [Steroidobacteraceae bacterium]